MCTRQYFNCLEKTDESKYLYRRQAAADVERNIFRGEL